MGRTAFLIVVILTILLGTAASANAAPTISGVSGTVSDGNTLTITGSALLNQNTANWYYTTGGFEGASLTVDGFQCDDTACDYDNTVNLIGNPSGGITSAGSQSYRGDYSFGGGATCPNGYQYHSSYANTTANGSGAVKYARIYQMWSSDVNVWEYNQYQKNLYFQNAGVWDFIQAPNWPTQIAPSAESASGSPTYSLNLPAQMQPNTWYCLEAEINCSAGTMSTWWDGVPLATVTGNDCSRPGTLMFGTVNACTSSNSWTPAGSIYMDGLAESTTRVYPAAIIEVTDNANYSSGNHVVLHPTKLSDASITIRYSDTGYNRSGAATNLSGSTRYLWVTDNQQNVSAGYNLAGGGGGGGGETALPTPGTPSLVE